MRSTTWRGRGEETGLLNFQTLSLTATHVFLYATLNAFSQERTGRRGEGLSKEAWLCI
jgi:hypothetical protein